MTEKEVSWEELHGNPDSAMIGDKFKTKLNKNPPKSWLKGHPIAKVKNKEGNTVAAKYLPIDKVEFMLDMIFQDWKVEILREGTMFNSVYATVRLHYLHPVKNDWLYHDGIGAQPVQTDAGFTAADLSHIKSAAVQMALPSAVSYAIKDAVEHLGKLFGRDINRADTVEFTGVYSGNGKKEYPDKSEERLILLIKNAKDRPSLEKLHKDVISEDSRRLYDETYKILK